VSRHIPDDFNSECLAEIDRRLAEIVAIEKVTIPLAIESGSRAWGFPSPDSDYDVRFIYFRPMEYYANLWPPRDVIEQPIEGDMDVNGWDLGKALKLMLKGNAVILEWLQSPIVYQCDDGFRAKMLALAEETVSRSGLLRHYYNLGVRQLDLIGNGISPAPIKKLFYAARPALALRWLRLNRDHSVPPMDFGTLIHGCDLPTDIKAAFEEFVERKAKTRELGSAPIPIYLLEFIHEEFGLAMRDSKMQEIQTSEELRKKAQAFFFATISNA
jgi:uncharacterized protein